MSLADYFEILFKFLLKMLPQIIQW